jgi:alkylation response protein AidB-like acyl-CoA dehydrogenase
VDQGFGLLTQSVPAEFGGQGADWATVYRTIRTLAGADSALAHVFAFHHLQLAGIRLYGSRSQQERLLKEIVDKRLFWGNALNPLDKRATATRQPSSERQLSRTRRLFLSPLPHSSLTGSTP